MKHAVSVEDKVVCITGAFGLIGSTVSKGFLDQGAKVLLTDVRSEKAEEMRGLLTDYQEGKDFGVVIADISGEEGCASIMASCMALFGRIDVLIHAAALDAKFDAQNDTTKNATRFENFPVTALEKSIQVNILGMVLITQAAIRAMLEQGHGNIIHVASTYSLVAPNPQLYNFGGEDIQFKPVDYVLTKSAVPNFTRYIATVYAEKNIRCNAIAPHGVYNDHPEKFVKNFMQLSPMKRMSGRDELIGPFTFLASDASSYMTGSILTVDGGWTAW